MGGCTMGVTRLALRLAVAIGQWRSPNCLSDCDNNRWMKVTYQLKEGVILTITRSYKATFEKLPFISLSLGPTSSLGSRLTSHSGRPLLLLR